MSTTLVIDCGNSQAKFGIAAGSEVIATFVLHNTEIHDKTAGEVIASQCQRYGASTISRVMVASVVPAVLQRLKAILPLITRARIDVVDHLHCGGMAVKVDTPAEVGPDRLVNAYAARELFGSRQIVIDFGTATTFDIVDAAGDYAGGVILPGLDLSLQTLHQATAMLPLVRITKAKRVMGKNTVEAINQGMYWGYIAMLEGLLERLQRESGYESHVIVTGGYADLWGEDLQRIDKVCTKLTLMGLALLAETE